MAPFTILAIPSREIVPLLQAISVFGRSKMIYSPFKTANITIDKKNDVE